MIERNIDCRKHRKSTHLASADLDVLTLEGKKLIFTIDDARFETGVNVSGTKTDGYFIKLKGVKKELMLNSFNRDIVAGLARNRGFKNEQAYNIGNWQGIRIEMYVDRNVKMMGKIVDGMRIRPIEPKEKAKPKFTEENFEAAHKAGATLEMIKKSYLIDLETEKKYTEYVTKK